MSEASPNDARPRPARQLVDWQLPHGVSRALWDYVHEADIARNYDASLADSSLFTVDLQLAQDWLQPPGKLIDLGCGTGRLMLDMARLGHCVLGVDLSTEMLRVARAKCQALNVDCVQANIVELDFLPDGVFDYAACLFSTLGMIEGREERRRVLGHVFRILKPGGRFLLHVHNWWFNFWDANGRHWLLGDLFRRVRHHPRAGDRLMPPHQGIANLSLHHFTRLEICKLLRAEGFRIHEVKPLGLRGDGRLHAPRWFGWLRAYGYLLAALK